MDHYSLGIALTDIAGTEMMPKGHFIAGPGKAFVAEAERRLFGEVGIGLFAGQTEILVVADDQADPFTIATDLLCQAEQGPNTPTVLITTSEKIGTEFIKMVDKLLEFVPTVTLASTSRKTSGEAIVEPELDEASYSLPTTTFVSMSRFLLGIQGKPWRRCRIRVSYFSVKRLASRTVMR